MPAINSILQTLLHVTHRSSRVRLVLFVIGGILVQSCTSTYYRRHAEPPPPPPPPPTCSASPVTDSSLIRGLDTVKPDIPNAPYYAFERVAGASSTLNEFGLITTLRDEERCLLLYGVDMKTAAYATAEKTGPSSISIRAWEGAPSMMPLSLVANANTIPDGCIAKASIAGSTIAFDSSATLCNDPLSWDGHPTLSVSGTWLVFASNRNGSLNSTDLWYAQRRPDGSFGVARPMHGVNTYCDEICPSFLPQTGLKLMFSSSGHSSFGGYDAFVAEIVEDGDSLIAKRIANLGTPINSEFDEIFPTVSPNGTDIYISTNRRLGRDAQRTDFDVFAAYMKLSGDQPVARLTGRVVNSSTQKPVVDAEVVARDAESRTVFSTSRTDTSGSYTLNVPVETTVQVTAQSDTLFYDSYTVQVPEQQADKVVERTEPIKLSSSFILRINFPTSEFDNPYGTTLDSNGIETDRTWQRELDDLATSVVSSSGKVRRIELVGHTDDVDTDASNMVLGQQRVNFVINELVKRGVPRSILHGSSDGEGKNLVRRKAESIDLWRKRCRRVELTKVSP